MRKRKKQARRSKLIVAVLAAAIGVGLFALYWWEKQDRGRESQEIQARNDDLLTDPLTVYYNGRWYRLRSGIESCLIMGLDKYSERLHNLHEDAVETNLQSDFLFLTVEDRKAGSYCAIHLNRDSMVEIQRLDEGERKIDTVIEQLALSHTYGTGGKDSCRNTVRAVSRLLYDVPIDHYYAVTMDAVPVLNDMVGGVTVHIDEDLTPADPAFVEGTDVTLQGQQALSFVRARKGVSDGSNLSRMNRQRTFINALYGQLSKKLESGSFALKMANTLSDYSTSDMIPDELAQWAQRLKDERFEGILTTPGEGSRGAETGWFEFHPDEEALRKLVIERFFEPV